MKVRVGPGESASEVVVRTVSEAESRAANTLPPLTSTIDPDALDTLCTNSNDGTGRYDCTLRFPYSDSEIRVQTHGNVTLSVTPRETG